MRPAWSVIVFTVLSGAGLGMAMFLPWLAARFSPPAFLAAAALSFALVAGGLLSSTLHLANPKNAWRALFRLRTSWLSREAVLALLFFPLFIAWAAGVFYGWRALWLDALLVLTAALLVFCTAMIYASLKPIPLWRHALTPVNYLLLSAASGLALLCAAHGGDDAADMLRLLWLLLALSAAGKYWHFRRARRMYGDVAAAVGLRAARVRLLESGHGGQNFLTREFVYQSPAAALRRARWLTIICAFALPLVIVSLALAGGAEWLAWLLPPPLALGLLAERWLFFAEAKHVVRLYHGEE